MVINNADVALVKYPGDTALIPRFEYLKALCIGKIASCGFTGCRHEGGS